MKHLILAFTILFITSSLSYAIELESYSLEFSTLSEDETIGDTSRFQIKPTLTWGINEKTSLDTSVIVREQFNGEPTRYGASVKIKRNVK